jgi:hypothetical protein
VPAGGEALAIQRHARGDQIAVVPGRGGVTHQLLEIAPGRGPRDHASAATAPPTARRGSPQAAPGPAKAAASLGRPRTPPRALCSRRLRATGSLTSPGMRQCHSGGGSGDLRAWLFSRGAPGLPISPPLGGRRCHSHRL